MNHILSNEYLTIEVSPHGAELQSIRNNRTGHEYLWQGNPAFWGRRSPVLFPIVGSLWNGEYHTGGNTYKMSQHGFARDMDFTIVEETETTLRFKLDSTPETLAAFPFCFSLEISYELNETRLEVGWMVKNLSETVMPFQIGAHPAFITRISPLPTLYTGISHWVATQKHAMNLSSRPVAWEMPCITLLPMPKACCHLPIGHSATMPSS